jgi:hypothetical protein
MYNIHVYFSVVVFLIMVGLFFNQSRKPLFFMDKRAEVPIYPEIFVKLYLPFKQLGGLLIERESVNT